MLNEASNGEGTAESVASATPWYSIDWASAGIACGNASKRLCTKAEWQAACQGGQGQTGPYGNTYQGDFCAGVDQSGEWIQPTGSKTSCEGGYTGIFDMSGNVAEWTSDSASPGPTCEMECHPVMGGSFNSDSAALTCTGEEVLSESEMMGHVGFRCCQDL